MSRKGGTGSQRIDRSLIIIQWVHIDFFKWNEFTHALEFNRPVMQSA
jgi:hypothetical protein